MSVDAGPALRAALLEAEGALARGDPRAAAAAFERAEALGRTGACAYNAGQAWRAAGEPALALAAWRRAAVASGDLGPKAFDLGRRLAAAGDRDRAAAVWLARLRAEPTAFDCFQAIVASAAADRAHATVPLAPAQGGDGPPPRVFSFVICSIDEARFAAVARMLGSRFGGREHEIVRVPDAKSLAEGYARGLARTRGDAVVFCHDDIELLAPDASERLATHLTRFDLVGVAGTTRATGPSFAWTGHPHLHGWVTHRPPGQDDYELSCLSFGHPAVPGIQALDGVFLACRRAAAERVGFDADTFDGFHGYDFDFSYRAHRAGCAIGVVNDLALVHASRGRFDEAWRRYAERARAKFPELDGPVGRSHFYVARVPDADGVLAAQRRLAGWIAASPVRAA